MKRTLSSQLGRLAARFARRPVRLRELVDILQFRGDNALLILLAIPFVTPIPLPGLSTLFGCVIALVGLRMALAQPLWLPGRVTARELPSSVLPKLLLTASHGFRRLEKLLKPRWLYPVFPAAFQRTSGVLVLVCGLLLLLPLPVPFSNALPALTVLLLAAAGLERDGAVFVAGCVQFLLCLGFFSLLAFGGNELWQRLFI